MIETRRWITKTLLLCGILLGLHVTVLAQDRMAQVSDFSLPWRRESKALNSNQV
jgi:hypothetical protein